jgi:hypothetical protein
MFAIASELGSRVAGCKSLLRRSNFFPADFPPEPPNLSFKEPQRNISQMGQMGHAFHLHISTQA